MGVFEQMAIVTGLAAGLGIAMNRLKQPVILGYILAGLLAATWGWFTGGSQELFSTFGEIGVTLLLFLVGMELSWPKMHALGKAALLTGIGQIVFTFVGGWLLALGLGFGMVDALYLGIVLTFSSTIVVIKLLGEKNDLQSLHGRIAVGILLIQDLVAILALVMLSGLAAGKAVSWWLVLGLLIKFGVLVVGMLVVAKYVVPRLLAEVANAPELLFLVSLAWGMGWAAFLSWPAVGFSIEVGGFVAGLTLANALEQHQILSRLRPLRDFFVMLFFVSLGASVSFAGLGSLWWKVVGLSVFVLVGNPLIVLLIMGGLKYRARTAFLTSLTMAQISEFGLILMALGLKLGHVDESLAGVVTMVGVITMLGSTYLILRADKIWRKYKWALKLFERRGSRDLGRLDDIDRKDHVVLIGCDRTGRAVLERLKNKRKAVVVDYNPEIVRELAAGGVEVVYGDAEDVDILEQVDIGEAKMVVSTVVDQEATLVLLEYLQTHKSRKKLLVVVTAAYPEEAKLFYDRGADYVVIPQQTTGTYLGELLMKSLRKGKDVVLRVAGKEKLALDRLKLQI